MIFMSALKKSCDDDLNQAWFKLKRRLIGRYVLSHHMEETALENTLYQHLVYMDHLDKTASFLTFLEDHHNFTSRW